ncbi:aldehyde dehydrogenase family protein [Glutamicibacter endophyticus]|uniref:aldehyde dehydrogenase family protein n=1 Tax=Glutamicibacter endophyticus TaxID=1522174 RepID=UPI003AF0C30C
MSTSPSATELRHYLDGRWLHGSGPVIECRSAVDPDRVLAVGRSADTQQIDAAFAAAGKAAGSWAALPMAERATYLLRAADQLTGQADALGAELAVEEGKTIAEGIAEVHRAAQVLNYVAGEAQREAGSIYHSPRANEQIIVGYRPLGVVAVITPFNFPIAIPAWKIAPALIYGNTVVFKPASAVPLLATRLVQALEAAGLPHGVLNMVLGPGSLGDELMAHPRLRGVSFTGSTEVGRQLCAAGAARGIPVQAEMGGKNAAVVLADADLEMACEQVLLGAFRSAGQKCTATSRLIVDHRVADELIERLCDRLETWVTGDPLAADVHMGPLVDERAACSARDRLARALASGATEVFHGTAPAGKNFLPPTLLEVTNDAVGRANPAWNEEFFAPVLTIVRVDGEAQAFAAANDGEYGLSLALFTKDLGAALRAQRSVDVGILHVNSESAGAEVHVPFGGAKSSGYGPKEQGRAAREFFTHSTTVYLRA